MSESTNNAAERAAKQKAFEAKLEIWRSKAVQRYPYFARMIFGLRYRIWKGSGIGKGTWSVDRNWRVSVDFDAVVGQGDDYNAAALVHECLHLYFQHWRRMERFNKEVEAGRLNQMAILYGTDMEINPALANDAFPEMDNGLTVMPKHYQLPDYLSAEEYVEAMRNVFPKPPKGQKMVIKGTGGGGQPQPGQGGGDGDPDDDSDDSDGSGSGGQPGVEEISGGCGSGAGHVPPGLANDDMTDADGGMSPEEQEAMLADIASDVMQYSKSRGTVPAGILAEAEVILSPPKLDWRTVLSKVVGRCVNNRAGGSSETYLRRNWRLKPITNSGSKVIMPGTFSPLPKVVVVRDTSGSVGQAEHAEFTSQMCHIGRQLRLDPNNLLFTDVDMEATPLKPLKENEVLNNRTGGGGTDMCVGIEMAKEANADVVVVFTDGYTPWPDERIPGMAVVACISNDGPEPPDHIQLVRVEVSD